MSWFPVVNTQTCELLETTEVHAMTPFDQLADDFPVWCANGEGRSVVVPRSQLVRIDA